MVRTAPFVVPHDDTRACTWPSTVPRSPVHTATTARWPRPRRRSFLRRVTRVASTFADPASLKGLTDADLKKLIVEGKPPMPAFKGALKGQEVDSVVAFIKSFPARTKK